MPGLTGAWLLEKWETLDPSGNRLFPLGRNARGVLMYSDNGYMSVNVVNPDRLDDIPTGMSLAAMGAGRGTFYGYSGPYVVLDGTVEHHITLCSVPERIGTVQKRPFSVSENRLVIRSETTFAGPETLRHELVWTRP